MLCQRVRVAGGDNRRSWRQGSRSLVTWEFVFKILATEDIWHQRWGSFLTMELVFQMPPTKVNKSLGYVKHGPAPANPTICVLKQILQNVKIYIYVSEALFSYCEATCIWPHECVFILSHFAPLGRQLKSTHRIMPFSWANKVSSYIFYNL